MFQGFGGLIFFLVVALLILVSLFRTVEQATVAVVTVFGKYHRVMREGLNIKLPWEKVAYRLSLQNRALQLEFQAITQDQANVKFATMVLYAVAAAEEEAIKNPSWKKIYEPWKKFRQDEFLWHRVAEQTLNTFLLNNPDPVPGKK